MTGILVSDWLLPGKLMQHISSDAEDEAQDEQEVEDVALPH